MKLSHTSAELRQWKSYGAGMCQMAQIQHTGGGGPMKVVVKPVPRVLAEKRAHEERVRQATAQTGISLG